MEVPVLRDVVRACIDSPMPPLPPVPRPIVRESMLCYQTADAAQLEMNIRALLDRVRDDYTACSNQ